MEPDLVILEVLRARETPLRPATTIVIVVLLLLIAAAGIIFVVQLLSAT